MKIIKKNDEDFIKLYRQFINIKNYNKLKTIDKPYFKSFQIFNEFAKKKGYCFSELADEVCEYLFLKEDIQSSFDEIKLKQLLIFYFYYDEE